jgi:beta-galactosidase
MDSVQLSLNGKDLGKKDVPKYGHVDWSVPYAPGVLEAVGFKGGKEVVRSKVETTGAPAKLVLTPDRTEIDADGRDLAVYTVSCVDAKGRAVANAKIDVDFSLDGPGTILGVGNGDPSSHERDRFFPTVVSAKVEGWKMHIVDAVPSSAPKLADLEKLGGKSISIIGAGQAIEKPGQSAIYWATVDLAADQLKSGLKTLTIGQIDDRGVVFLNGKQVGTTDQWDRSYSWDVATMLKPGKNEIVVVVGNQGGRGGLGYGVSITGGMVWPKVSRRLFNGLAQVIVQSGKTPGPITLKAYSAGLEAASSRVSSR